MLKGDDDLETRARKRDGSVEEWKCSMVEAVVAGTFVSNAPASHTDALQFQLLTKICFGF